jgi:hypothetical protein
MTRKEENTLVLDCLIRIFNRKIMKKKKQQNNIQTFIQKNVHFNIFLLA